MLKALVMLLSGCISATACFGCLEPVDFGYANAAEQPYTVQHTSGGDNLPNVQTTANQYQGKPVTVKSPGSQTRSESDMTKSQMISQMGSNYSADARSQTQDDVSKLLQNYWLPNASDQIYSTFQSFQGASHNVDVTFSRNIPDTFGTNSWARTYYYGYGQSGRNNRMVSISIEIDLNDCLDPSANGSISGLGDAYKFDQIIAHEMMHVYMAETAPGYMLGSTHREWFSEGAAEMAGGGIYHMGNRTASQMCGSLGQGNIDYGGSYLAVCYASYLSANQGYGGTCTVSASNLAYGLDRILAKLRETGNLNTALSSTTGMDAKSFESLIRSGDGGKLQSFLEKLVIASTNSEGILGCGSVIGGNLKLQQEFVVCNHKSTAKSNAPLRFTIIKVV